MNEDNKNDPSIRIKESDIKGEKIIFDLLIKDKLAHVIVIKDMNHHYHINLNGEDLGSFTKDDNGKIERFGQHKGADAHFEDYFKPIEIKLGELGY